jgi:CheY-like chemotaxis protein
MNLVLNARDAMAEGGTLTVETANVDLGEGYAATHGPVVPGRYVMLAVSDTGEGMDEELQSHIFEPFFTTKKAGEGTGLGLATVYGIVKQSGGYIWTYSEPGMGTSFKIYLPRVDEAVESPRAIARRGRQIEGMETLLVVEDEEAVLALACRILRSGGYTVLEARNGVEGLRVCEQHRGAIDLVITDVVMPELGGPQLVEQLTSLRGNIKALYMSGYMDNTTVEQTLISDKPFLQKPFSPQTLPGKVREVLDAPHEPSHETASDRPRFPSVGQRHRKRG